MTIDDQGDTDLLAVKNRFNMVAQGAHAAEQRQAQTTAQLLAQVQAQNGHLVNTVRAC